jgi:hypothetical protein
MHHSSSGERIDAAVVALLSRIARGAAQSFETAPGRVRGCRASLLEHSAVRLLERLPADLRLVALRGHYPRLLNRIAAAWSDPRRFDRLIDELLVDDRPNRQGFPFEVVRELTELREHYFDTVHPGARRAAGSGGIRGFR